VCGIVAVVLLGSLPWSGSSAGTDRAAIAEQARGVFGPLPTSAPGPGGAASDAQVALGRILYYEPRLSRGGEIACNSCHLLDRFGVDGEATSAGHAGQRGGRNAPTVYNAALNFRQFWDGRAADVEEQAKGPVLNPIEMGLSSPGEVESILKGVEGYPPLFRAAFPDQTDPVSFDNMAIAIGAFERGLLTPSRFDDFMAGDLDALSDEEIQGYSSFVQTGCPTCHMGPLVGGAMYQKLGLIHPYETQDPGREAATKQAADRGFFKVPSLRNVQQTGPWFHDGSIGDLDEAVRLMAWHQLGRQLSEQERASIISFLGSLTGRIDDAYIAEPALP
jgi:cytochrome c peroxidase